MTATISVIIPCFNLGRFLAEAVDSVVGQTFSDYGIIVVDDGSTDVETRALLTDLSRPRTRVVLAEHRGPGAARNLGFREAQGAFLCFLDADDILAPTWFAHAVGAFARDPDLAFVSCWVEAFGDEQWVSKPTLCDLLQILEANPLHCSTLLRREVFATVGGFDETLGANYEDWELWIRIAQHSRGTIIPEVLFRYRRRRDSASSRARHDDWAADAARLIVSKHRALYQEYLPELLVRREANLLNLRRQIHDQAEDCRARLGPHVDRLRWQLGMIGEQLLLTQSSTTLREELSLARQQFEMLGRRQEVLEDDVATVRVQLDAASQQLAASQRREGDLTASLTATLVERDGYLEQRDAWQAVASANIDENNAMKNSLSWRLTAWCRRAWGLLGLDQHGQRRSS